MPQTLYFRSFFEWVQKFEIDTHISCSCHFALVCRKGYIAVRVNSLHVVLHARSRLLHCSMCEFFALICFYFARQRVGHIELNTACWIPCMPLLLLQSRTHCSLCELFAVTCTATEHYLVSLVPLQSIIWCHLYRYRAGHIVACVNCLVSLVPLQSRTLCSLCEFCACHFRRYEAGCSIKACHVIYDCLLLRPLLICFSYLSDR